MRSTFESVCLSILTLWILVDGTNGRQCYYIFSRCVDKGDIRGKCSDMGGTCFQVPGMLECRCYSPINVFGPDEVPST
ncbi:hypothetical protein CHS0354_038896 [Potamilus streckersoni]|uniref:Uncharacterized protein n=1 Tax=Potamilus streckersoni TaxID=2493646 RepID=A0AAE0RKJ1_9BIVA|nr:hypothetical protein CHS0354_038896 [Potamilus streckersoni]